MATTRNLGLALFDNGKENAEQWVKQQNHNGEGTAESPFSNAQIIDNWAGTVRQLPATTSEDAGKFYSVGPDGKPIVQKVEVGNAGGGSNLIAKTETEMETFLTLDNVGKIVSYIGDNGKYEANRVYSIAQENDTVIANPIGIKVESITFEGVQLILTLDNGETITTEIPHTTAILGEESAGGGGNLTATSNEEMFSFLTSENIGKLISYVGLDETLYERNSLYMVVTESGSIFAEKKSISKDDKLSFSPEDSGKFLVVDEFGQVVAKTIDKAEGGAY